MRGFGSRLATASANHVVHSTQETTYNVFPKNHMLYQAIEDIKPPLELHRVKKGGTTCTAQAIQDWQRHHLTMWFTALALPKLSYCQQMHPLTATIMIHCT